MGKKKIKKIPNFWLDKDDTFIPFRSINYYRPTLTKPADAKCQSAELVVSSVTIFLGRMTFSEKDNRASRFVEEYTEWQRRQP